MSNKTNEDYNALAETFAEAMMEKIHEQGIIGEIMEQYDFDKLFHLVTMKFSLKIINHARIYAHNCGKYDKEQIDFIDLMTETTQGLADMLEELKQGEEDETRD